MKRLIVCCDGTWNGVRADKQTNVLSLAHAVPGNDDKGVAQVVYYTEGVGAGRGASPLSKFIDKIGGGAFGWGLTDNVADCYRFLILNYSPGDEIYIFGYSRGAYTARSLAGLIRTCSILTREHVGQIDKAFELYRMRGEGAGPDMEQVQEFRALYAPARIVSDADEAWRRIHAPELAANSHRLRITYIGVWDTVGALGIPNSFSVARFFNKKYQFHDHALSSSVRSARHAVAIDERRSTFAPTLWENLEKLNADSGTAPGKAAPYQQSWFPGDHGSVGGGGDFRHLSAEAMRWIVEGAMAMGLAVHPDLVGFLEGLRDHRGPLAASEKKASFFGALTRLTGATDRKPPSRFADISRFAIMRWRERPQNLHGERAYRPKTLAPFASDLDGASAVLPMAPVPAPEVVDG